MKIVLPDLAHPVQKNQSGFLTLNEVKRKNKGANAFGNWGGSVDGSSKALCGRGWLY
ncbi:hypothetical protein JK635_14420 [Neobacillus sp. YIM B02564]|uniref:Plantaricin C family lantibiotic n=1 Tax=Neobacillus paridis TaxID=2803862 RepID=A0ABS1TU23_9BACI|nr:hypothetical protein [Neobacillus paridis]